MSLRSARSTAVALITLATFSDIVAYAIAIPVLPDLSARLGASPTVVGLLFGSFGVTLLAVSVPMGAVSDRIGRRAPMVGGLLALAAATLLFALSTSLAWLFAARLVQGAADAITWVVGFALIADLYKPEERGRVTGLVLGGTNLAVIVGPTLGGWLYELGGIRLPFLFVVGLSLCAALAFLWIDIPRERGASTPVPVTTVFGARPILVCAVAVVAGSATISMLEPVLSMHLGALGVRPGRVGTLFGIGAVASTLSHPLFGRLADRFGARRLTQYGLVAASVTVVLLGQAWDYTSAVALFALGAVSSALIITPSLSYMGEATAEAGILSFGVAYGIYNMAWGAGLLTGPSLGGAVYDQVGFARLALIWAPGLLAVSALVAGSSYRNSIGVTAVAKE